MTEQPSAQADQAGVEPQKKDKKKKQKEESRGIDTMYRVTYQNHVALSRLADNKANMLISINGLIISVIIAVLTPRFGSWSWSLFPSLVLVAGCLTSLTFAVLAARPRIDRTPLTLDNVRNGEANPLFFGHFTNMPLADFQAAVRALGKDRRLLLDSLSRQLYEMGGSLLRKYRYLQIAYAAFLVGIGLAAALFAAVLLSQFLAPTL